MLETKASTISKSLAKNDTIFNFATDFYIKNQNGPNTLISSAAFNAYKQLVRKNEYKMSTETEKSRKHFRSSKKKY
jgi:carboxyl-terminal processing protease